MCMTTNDHRCRVTETNLHGALDDEELFIIEGSSCTVQQKPPQTAKNRALVLKCPGFNVRTALKKLQPEASEWRPNTGFEFTAT